MDSSVNVLICDGRKLVREALSMLMEKHAGIRMVGEAQSVEAAIKLIRPLDVDVVVHVLPQCQIAVSSLNPMLKTVRGLRESSPDVKIVVLGYSLALSDARAFITAGAAACLTEECASDELVAAIHAAADGQIYLSPRLTEQVVRTFMTTAAPDSGLTAPRLARRELEVLRHYALGKSTKEIAFELHVGRKTVETHRRRIMQKLHRHSVAELTQYAVMKGLISLPDRASA